MARSYNAKLVALTIGVQAKWLDNLLSHSNLPGVARGRQGVERRITDVGLLAIELVRIATSELGIPLARAVEIAAVVVTSPTGERHFSTSSGASIHFPLAHIDRRLRERMLDAIEAVPRMRRGRPRLN